MNEAKNILRRGIIRRLIVLAAIIVVWIAVSQCVVVTNPNQFVAVRQFGEVIRITYEPGLSFKAPFVQSASAIPRDVQHYDMPISDVITQDKKTMVADTFVLWRVSDPLAFIRKASASVAQAESFIGNNSYNSLKNVIGRMPQADIISGRDTLAQQIFRNLDNALDEYGLEMIAIETKHLDLPDDNKNAVYDRMISERNNIAAQYTAEGDEEARKIRTETDKTVNIQKSNAIAQAADTIAEGESKYMEILNGAYNSPEKAEFYAFVRALESAKTSLQGDNKTLILGLDSPIAKVFYNN
ncbi:MAG: protease modulator HflC [Oscillospiraceae bacterium]|jgi:membrane protease subunit HflC|nr:protease modulator HflC [Oscillospiraceae bacterium]